jgi:glutamate dehydrogenase
MKIAYKQHHASQMDKILAARPREAGDVAHAFIQEFYAKMPVPDLERMEPKQAVELALSAFEFMQKRDGDAPRIRIFTPTKKDHGYDGKYTVVELLNTDMPFLVDSLTNELMRHGLAIRETLHPIFRVVRDKKGVLTSLTSGSDKKAPGHNESLIHFEISALPDSLPAEQLQTDLEWVLSHIRTCVADWQAIVKKINTYIDQLEPAKKTFDKETVAEVGHFLRWLSARNFVFLGYSEYDFYDAKHRESVHALPASRLGITKITEENTLQNLDQLLASPLIEITKSSRRSAVHRPVPMDYIALKRTDAKGKVTGELRLLGLFTSNVYYQSTEGIPLVRHKVAQVLERSNFDPASHDGKSLKTILEFLPRDEIFQMSTDELFETSMGILALEAKPGVRMFVRRDGFERFVSCMVFVPREQFSTDLRHQIQQITEQVYNGSASAFSTQITEAPLARLHLIIKTTPGDIPSVDVAAVEKEIAKRAYLWSDLLFEELLIKYGEHKAEQVQRVYGTAFPQHYINHYNAGAAVYDIEKIEEATRAGSLALELFRIKGEADCCVHLKIYNPKEEIAISDILPMLENAGFRAMEEHPFLITQHDGARVWIRDFKLESSGGQAVALEPVKALIEELLLKVWHREVENDRFNALALKAQLNWRQVTMLRAYAKYLKQAGFSQGQTSIEQAFNQHPDIARTIVALFAARFDVQEKDRDAKTKKLQAKFEEQLAEVSNASEDRILRRYVEVIHASLRTNYFQCREDGECKPVISFKFNSHQVPDLPKPVPYAEIFVYSPRVEGIHLRGGKVARGGLRWSDRHDDFRTEVLGLMKAQMVKNSVIVPVGSKGGFVVKTPTASREAFLEEGIACYKLYLSGLLDITDNIVAGKITPPAQVVRHDEDDPYLVVAADKGTASFSDIANGVSADYGFWLGDAFASGGSVGYDHKEMAITARGGWVSVVRHFREMGVDIGKEDFTVAGIGDMAGDVFGNGMLLSKHIRLVAAFNHLHIFIDPSPDAKHGFEERKRLFRLPRSSWKDYDEKLISKGGGIYERSAKTIELSKEAQAALGVSKARHTPDELIRAILLAPVDLLWNGGIGTYVKAEDETHDQVGDRANNTLRVGGKDLRCKVVGEGGNLGFTQKGRIEYARNNGRINTDAIDNSAGVDCSDHEVNIKIALSPLAASGKLPMKERDKLLAAMTDEVARLVLKDNILQTQAITIAQLQGATLLESQQRLMHTLERTGLLDRAIEFLPADKQIADMIAAKRGLTRPEIAVLLSYSKMELYRQLLESTLPDEAYFIADLKRYFPHVMQDDFADSIAGHRLKREIIATVATNSIVNRVGITFFNDLAQDMNASARDVVAAYTIARDAFGLRGLWKDIEALEGVVSAQAQVELIVRINRFLERACVWLLRNLPRPLNLDKISKEIVPAIADIDGFKASLPTALIRSRQLEQMEQLTSQDVPEALAEKITALDIMAGALDIIAVAGKGKTPLRQAGKLYFETGERFSLDWLREKAAQSPTNTHWERLAVQAIIHDAYDEQRRLTLAILGDVADVAKWTQAHADSLARFDHSMGDIKTGESHDVAKLMVALRVVRTV